MTVSDTSTRANVADAVPPGASRRPYRPRLEENAGRLVDQRIGGTKRQEGLQARYRRNEARARGELAALRKGANRPPGELPEIWELTSVHVPDYAGDAPTWEETAVHTAMTLYAVHQQSQTEAMFAPGRGLGHAARSLKTRHRHSRRCCPRPEPPRRRFGALLRRRRCPARRPPTRRRPSPGR